MNPFADILENYLNEFREGLVVLHAHAHDLGQGVTPKEVNATARLLCGLSRDIMFTVGLVSDDQSRHVDAVIDAFQDAVTCIPDDGDTGPMTTYKKCIGERREDLIAEKTNALNNAKEAR